MVAALLVLVVSGIIDRDLKRNGKMHEKRCVMLKRVDPELVLKPQAPLLLQPLLRGPPRPLLRGPTIVGKDGPLALGLVVMKVDMVPVVIAMTLGRTDGEDGIVAQTVLDHNLILGGGTGGIIRTMPAF